MLRQSIQRALRWYRTEHFISQVLTAMEQERAGVEEARWAARSSLDEVLAWYDVQLSDVRQPYGHFGVKIVAVRHDTNESIAVHLLTHRTEWYNGVRAQLAAEIALALPYTDVSTGIIALSSAMHTVLLRHY